jgi:DNA-binding MltR family transcriptional regulator
LDAELEELLRKFFVQDDNNLHQIFYFNGPCGTFSSKINMAYALGLIGKKAHKDLRLIRKIRNDFGHIPTPLKFEDEAISDRCKELYYDGLDIKASARTKFTRVATGILAVIHAAMFKMKKCEPPTDFEITNETKEPFRKILSDFVEILAHYENDCS